MKHGFQMKTKTFISKVFSHYAVAKRWGENRGGIGWFIREDLRKWIKIMFEMSNENFLWCKLDKHFFNFEEDLYVCSFIREDKKD